MKSINQHVSALALTAAIFALPGVSSATDIPEGTNLSEAHTVAELRANPLNYNFLEGTDTVSDYYHLLIPGDAWRVQEQWNITDGAEPCAGSADGAGCSDIIRKVNDANGANIYFWSGINGFVPGTDDLGWAALPNGAPAFLFNEDQNPLLTIKNWLASDNEIVIHFAGDAFSPAGVSDQLSISVPEPATLALMMAGLFGIGSARRRSARV